jgi:streptomycin 6-kinase
MQLPDLMQGKALVPLCTKGQGTVVMVVVMVHKEREERGGEGGLNLYALGYAMVVVKSHHDSTLVLIARVHGRLEMLLVVQLVILLFCKILLKLQNVVHAL